MNPRGDAMPSSVVDLATLGKLLEDYRPRLLAMVERRLDPKLAARLDAEEILSEAFLEARRKWPAFRQHPDRSSYSWLYRIVLDCLIEAWRRNSRSPRDVTREMPWPAQSSVQLGLGLIGTGTSPSEAAVRDELRERVRQVIALLKEKDRQILWMRHADQLTHQEVADVLDITVNAATVRYARALQRFKALWERLGI